MKFVKKFFKWIGIIIWVFLIFAIMQVPQVETTPTYEFEGWKEFHEIMRQISIPHHIFLMVLFTIITLIMEWFLCKWVGNKLDLTKKMTLKKWIWGIVGGITSYLIAKLLLIDQSQSTGTNIYSATAQTALAIPMFIAIVMIAPVLEEFLFQAAIQKGIFKKLNPWIAIILTSMFFGLAHTGEFNFTFWNIFISGGVPFAFIYQETDDIKTPIIAHSVNNLIPFIVAYVPYILSLVKM
ncbi:hypothetical protein GCM10022297_11530 [Lactobacillus hamsteri]|nr:type II CAAX endopeptidase family protein [Lactobacillus hamsteri]